ncbi:MAG: hypothetical protein ACRD4J_07810 [Nitrososphaeraceae archaeon]
MTDELEKRIWSFNSLYHTFFEHVFINLFKEENRNSPNVDVDIQAQSQSQSQNNNQEQTTTIINCPPDSRCVIEQ